MNTAKASKPARNIELKARCDNLAGAERLCQEMGASVEGLLFQTDTYFRVSNGRLKLRRTEPEQTELIWYARPDEPSIRRSDYIRVAIADPDGLLLALSSALEVLVEVKKRRKLLLWQNVRIHLDEVQGLGTFIELEAVLSPGEPDRAGHKRVDVLCKRLSINEKDRIGGSYADLALAK